MLFRFLSDRASRKNMLLPHLRHIRLEIVDIHPFLRYD